jgi:hypothetical protein
VPGPEIRTDKAGAGLVGDGVKRQQRLAHSPVASFRPLLEWYFGPLAKDAPLLTQEDRESALGILHPLAPLRGGTTGCVVVAWIAADSKTSVLLLEAGGTDE